MIELAPGTLMLCPSCRVFVDSSRFGVSGNALVRCPWCRSTGTASAYAEAATRDCCAVCAHPRAAHVAWYTPDGSPPDPLTRPHSHALSAPCCICAASGSSCAAVDGSREVVT